MSVRRGHVGKEVDRFLSLECGGADTWTVPCYQNGSCIAQFGFAFFGTTGRTERIRSAELMIGIETGLESGLGGDTTFAATDCF